MTKRICRECGREFTGSKNAMTCPACKEKHRRRLPPSELDDLMLDVRQADAEGKSYGYWRVGLMLEKQKAGEGQRGAASAGEPDPPHPVTTPGRAEKP